MAGSPALRALARFTAAAILFTLAAAGPVHDLLRSQGLPAGLLPKSVESYTIDETTGLLEVRLAGPCYVRYDGPVLFDRLVRGNLTYGGLSSVVGLSQEELFLWFPVNGIFVSDQSSGLILFDIGAAHKQMSVSLFESPPDCLPEKEGERVSSITEEISWLCTEASESSNYAIGRVLVQEGHPVAY